MKDLKDKKVLTGLEALLDFATTIGKGALRTVFTEGAENPELEKDKKAKKKEIKQRLGEIISDILNSDEDESGEKEETMPVIPNKAISANPDSDKETDCSAIFGKK